MNKRYYLNDAKDMIYEVSVADVVENVDGREGYIVLDAELVCGKEYPTDNFNIDGIRWCSPDYFVDDVKTTSIIQYFETESMEEAIEDNEGWEPWKGELPFIYEWVDE